MEGALQLIVLADDPLARAGLAALLATLPDCTVVAQGNSDLLYDEGLTEFQADLIVWDVGWEASEFHREERPDSGLPVLALVAGMESAAAAWRLGCRGVITREMDEDRLAVAVAAVAAGLTVLAPGLAATIAQTGAVRDTAAIVLTPREREVLALLAEGLTNKAIAHRLTISDHTVKFHVNAILNKLDAQSRTDAVVRATRFGLLAL